MTLTTMRLPIEAASIAPLSLSLAGNVRSPNQPGLAKSVSSLRRLVVHRLRDRNDLDAKLVKLGRVAERVPGHGVAALGAQGGRKVLAGEVIGQLLHFRWIGAARMQHGAAAPIDGAGFLAVQGDDVAAPTGRVVRVQVREALPAAPTTYFRAIYCRP